MRKITFFCLLTLFSCSLLQAADRKKEAPADQAPQPISGTFSNETAIKATRKLGKNFWSAIDRYYKSLAYAKTVAVRKADVAETGKIEDALSGQSVDDFTSGSAKSARRTFLSNLESACRSYSYQLKAALREILKAGNQEEAEHIQAVLDAIEQSRTANTRIRHTITVHANKDWQKSGIEVKKGTVVTISASGSWSPGARKKVGKQKWDIVYGDADTYNLQVRINGKVQSRGGKSWRFTAHQDGELSFRMAPYRWRGRLGEAKGTLRVRVNADLLASGKARSLEEVVRDLVPSREELAAATATAGRTDDKADPGKKPAVPVSAKPPTIKPSTQTISLKATRTWQDTVIEVPEGATIHIQADGEWSPGLRKIKKERRKRFKRISGTADRFNLEAMVGTTEVGHGGSSWSFKTPNKGVLYLRMAKKALRKVRGEPEGALTLKITVEPADTGK